MRGLKVSPASSIACIGKVHAVDILIWLTKSYSREQRDFEDGWVARLLSMMVPSIKVCTLAVLQM